MSGSFAVKFSYKGKSFTQDGTTHQTTSADLLAKVRASFEVEEDVILRLIYKGKTIAQETYTDDDGAINSNDKPAFSEGTKIPKSGAKVVVMGSAATGIEKLNAGRSDPTIRGFADEVLSSKKVDKTDSTNYWGPHFAVQDGRYKFCRFEECTDASFGARPGASTPHAYQAKDLLVRLACDPGIAAIMKSRELVTGTLGEMDPIDDRLMKKTEAESGGCLLGYNTNHGMRIDVKLRTDDLGGFRPYHELASTLIHELSHNWVGEHNALFWTNFGQMRVEYLWKHARLMRGGAFGAGGKRTAVLAGVDEMISPNNNSSSNSTQSDTQIMDNICKSVFDELARDMAQHGLPVQLVARAVLSFSKELMVETKDDGSLELGGHRLGGDLSTANDNDKASARERALAAAEKRAKHAKDYNSG